MGWTFALNKRIKHYTSHLAVLEMSPTFNSHDTMQHSEAAARGKCPTGAGGWKGKRRSEVGVLVLS